MSSDASNSNPTTIERPDSPYLSSRGWVITMAIAVGMTLVCWSELYLGYGFIGGDIYPYFMPQKTYYADALKQGTIPLWNNLTGFGYPLVGESQTGVFYPPNLLLYRFLDVQTAYNASHIGHYIFAFVGVVLLGKRLGMSLVGAIFAAVVFVYGWFPVRSCLEWAIVTGSYLPWAIWLTESFIATRRRSFLVGLSVVTALQLLAGHFNLAFITTLTAVLYAVMRCFALSKTAITENKSRSRTRPIGVVLLLLVVGYCIAAVQLLPSYELKQLSQRSLSDFPVTEEFLPQYGHIPPWYLTQLIMPWTWYGVNVDLDSLLNSNKALSVSVATNKVEAHLYCGMIPILSATVGLLLAWKSREAAVHRSTVFIWFVLGLLAAIYATGWLFPVLGWLPGFSYFRGPGRYGIVTTLAVAMCAGIGWEMIVKRFKLKPAVAVGIGIAAIGITTADLMWAASNVGFNPMSGYTFVVADPPVNHRFDKEFNGQKTLRAVLEEAPNQPVRLFSPATNIPNIIGVSSYPVYLGIGPKQYFDPELKLTLAPDNERVIDGVVKFSEHEFRWMRENGITHILSFHPLEWHWPAKKVWRGFDPVISPALARFQEPLFLYELTLGSKKRVRFGRIESDRHSNLKVTTYEANRIIVEEPGNSNEIIFRDLQYPGWYAEVDGKHADIDSDGLFRRVRPIYEKPADQNWKKLTLFYRPMSVYGGAIISLLTLLGLMIYAFGSRRLPKRIMKESDSTSPA